MVRSKKVSVKGGAPLSPNELSELQSEKKEREETLRYIEENPGSGRAQVLDKAKVKRERDYFEKVIIDNSPAKVRGANKDELRREAEMLKEQMMEGMPTWHEMNFPADHPGCIQKHINWSKRNELKVKRYKTIMRQLEPQDPTATDVECWRKEK